ncbi:MAG TPA: hypothetical protein PKY63_06350 [Bacteroidales bacterium]|nr:hypothetical protein [Bacteroidales bacterium]
MKLFPHFPKMSFALIIICFLLPFVTVKCGNYEIAKMNGIHLATGTQIEADSDEEPYNINPDIFIISSMILAVAGLIMAFLKFRGNTIASLIVSVLGLAALVYFYFHIRKDIPSEGSMVIIISMGTGYYLTTIGFLLNSLFFGYQLSLKKEIFEAETRNIEPE